MNAHPGSQKGFMLVEVLVGIAVFVIVALSIFNAYIKAMETVRLAKFKITTTALANEQKESGRGEERVFT